MRALRQQESVPQAAQDCQCQRLGNVSVGGWIVIGFLVGICCGAATTILFQFYRRKKEERYLAQAPVGSWTTATDAVQQKSQLNYDGQPVTGHRQSANVIAAIPAGSRSVHQQQKYYAPLTKSLSVASGSLMLGVEGLRSSKRLSDMGGGDTGSKGTSDQRPGSQTSFQGLPAVQSQSSYLESAPAHQASRLSQADRIYSAPDQQHSALSANASQLQVPRPLPSSSPDSSDPDYNMSYQQQLPTMPECLPSPTGHKGANMHPSDSAVNPRLDDAGAHRAAGGSTTAAHQAQQQSPQATARAGANKGSHAESSLLEVDDAYEEDELDDDWKRLLGDVDDRLLAQNQRVMDAKERSVAIKKLLVATGTRGVDFAMNAALQEVLQFRKFHGL